MPSLLAIFGYALIIIFMYVLMKGKMTATTALILIPAAIALISGFGMDIGKFSEEGIKSIAMTAALMMFAVMYFAVMLRTGLFDPVIKAIIKWIKGDPVKLLVGTAVLCLCISLDGDSVTTYIIACTALVPIYRKMNINTLYLASLAVMA